MLASSIILLALTACKMSTAIPILVALNVSTTLIPVDVLSSTIVPLDVVPSSTVLPLSSTDFTGPTRLMEIIISSTEPTTTTTTKAEVIFPAPSNPDHVVSDAERIDVVVVPTVKARELVQEDVQTDTATRNNSVAPANSQPRMTGTAIVPAVQLPAGSIIINPPKNVQSVRQPTLINGQPLPTSSFPVNQPLPLTSRITPPFVVAEPVQGPVVGIPTGAQQRFF